MLGRQKYIQVEIAVGRMKRHKSQVIDQILAELIQAGGNTLHSAIHKLINSIWNKEEFPHQ
jgi:peptidyl-tRNA hydrolase